MARVIWQPQPRQAEFLRRPEYEVLYGGAAGGGKSDSLLMWVLQPYQVPHYQGLLLRKTYPELEEIINRSIDLYPKIVPGCRYNANSHVWRFPSGSRVYLGSMHRVQDVIKYQGRSFSRIGFDELTHFTYQEYSYMFSRNRPNGPGLIPLMRGATNPGGIGHAWVKQRFIESRKPGQSYSYKLEIAGQTYTRHRAFIPATVFDNQILLENDPMYVASMGLMNEATRKALLEGSWDSFSGQAFPEWSDQPACYKSREWTHVIEPFKIPATWRRFRSYDFGYAKPFSVIWYAMDNDGRLYAIRELYGTNGTPNEGNRWDPVKQAQEIKLIEDEDPQLKGHTIMGVADPSIWDRSRGESIADMMESQGVFWSKGDNKRIPGKQQVHWRLAFDADGCPMFYSFSTCKHLNRTLPALVYDMVNVEDIDSDGEDHCLHGDTLVMTTAGLIKIKDLADRHDVMLYGPDGNPRSFKDVRLTQKQAKVVKIDLSNGKSVICTPNHRFMTKHGWLRVDEMSKGMSLKHRSTHTTQLDMEVIVCESSSNQKGTRNSTENRSICAGNTSNTKAKGCTGRCGSIITDLFPRVCTFITSMRTGLTTRSITLSSKQPQSTCLNTSRMRLGRSEESGCLNSCIHCQRSGTSQRPEELGIENTLKMSGQTKNQSHTPAPSVEKSIKQGAAMRMEPTTSAIKTASKNLGQDGYVEIVSISEAGRADVYNLHVPDGNAYLLDGGLITHNCYDSLRYMCMEHPIPPQQHHRPPIILEDPLDLHRRPATKMFMHL
jgi:hypothetical protein